MANPDWTEPSDFNDRDKCDGCGEQRVIREVLDGDKLCQSCCDAWCRAEGQAEAEHRRAEHHYALGGSSETLAAIEAVERGQ